LAASPEPGLTGSLQQGVGADHVGADEFVGTADRTVHVGFGGKMDHGVDLLLGQEFIDQFLLQISPCTKRKVSRCRNRLQTGQVAGVGQGVQHHQPVGGWRRIQ